MRHGYAAAELLVALLRLGGMSRIPGDSGRLDRALHGVRERLPGALSDLSFGNGSVGLRCYELPDLLLRGQEALLLSILPPAFNDYAIELSEEDARVTMIQNGLSTEDGKRIGGELVGALGAVLAS